jgi:ABC-2 type transport system permease protein
MLARPLWALSAARIKQFLREPGSLFWTFGFPLLITVALGTAFRNQGPARNHVAVLAGPESDRAISTLAGDRAIDAAVVDAARAARQQGTGEVVPVSYKQQTLPTKA